MSSISDSVVYFHALQLAQATEPAHILKWLSEISSVINSMGGKAIIPARHGRTEPILRRSGAIVIDEPLDEDMRRGAKARLEKIAVEKEVSAYIAHDFESAKLAQSLVKKWKAPIIFVCQNFLDKQGFLTRLSSRINYNAIDHFIVPSRAASDHLMTALQIEKHRITIVREGIDLKLVSDQSISQERTVSLAHSWGVIEKVVEIVLIPENFGSDIWQGNLLKLMANWQSHQSIDIHFVVIGDDTSGANISKLRTKIQRQSPAASIQFVGHCADIEAAIKLSSIVLLLEGEPKASFPIALLSQAIGRFTILTDTLAAGEFIADRFSGAIVENDPELISQQIIKVISRSESERNATALAGRAFITQNNMRDAMHASLKAVFESDTIG